MYKVILVKTYFGRNTEFPGTPDNPMLPELYIHPLTGKEEQAHYNSRNLITNKDYEDAGFVWTLDMGWAWPVKIE